MRHFEQWLAALIHAPLSTAAKLDLLAIVNDYVVGHVVGAAEALGHGRADPDEIGTAADVSAAAIRQLVDAQLASGRFPQLAALAGDPAFMVLSDSGQLDDRFELGLRLLIDGIAAEAASEQR